jgi:hypothetical protein
MPWQTRIPLLGGQFQFESNSRELLALVNTAYAGLPRHRLSSSRTPFRIQLRLEPRAATSKRAVTPPAIKTLSGPSGLVCAIMDAANFAILSPAERTGLIVVSPDMLAFPYHLRYELIEFAVFTLATRALGLVPLHAACVARAGRGLLIMGASGAGKSTLALLCLLQGLHFLSEDAVFVKPDQLLASGVSNFLHVRADSLRLLDDPSMAARVRKSPVIFRRSGVRKFEVDLRRLGRRLAAPPVRIEGIVFLSSRMAAASATVLPLSPRQLLARLRAAQPYAAQLPSWKVFRKQLAGIKGFELRRGRHAAESAVALRHILEEPRLPKFRPA